MDHAVSPLVRKRIRVCKALYHAILCILAAAAILVAGIFQIRSVLSGNENENENGRKEQISIILTPFDGASGTRELYILASMAEMPVAMMEYDKLTELSGAHSLHALYRYDPTLVPEGEYAIIPSDLSGKPESGELLLSNETTYTPDLSSLLHANYPIEPYAQTYRNVSVHSEPIVLILHTHGTEAYSPEGAISFPDETTFRSEDAEENVVAVGAVMAETLNAAGIPTIHCRVMHDAESYLNSYNRAAATIQEYLAQYPSIRYVFDIHRDSIATADGGTIRPVTLAEGIPTAQIMSVVGTDFKGANHPFWTDNLTIAVKLQTLLNDQYGNLARPINLRGASFNEHFTNGSLLLEIGSCGNTLTEAKHAGILTAEALAVLIKGR